MLMEDDQADDLDRVICKLPDHSLELRKGLKSRVTRGWIDTFVPIQLHQLICTDPFVTTPLPLSTCTDSIVPNIYIHRLIGDMNIGKEMTNMSLLQ